jgi:3-oxoacyl-[acyl-carrier-protein] synthase-3
MVEGGGAMMQTQAEELLVQGVKVAKAAWTRTKSVLGWTNDTPDLICTHQVGRSHRDHLYSALELDPARDFPTVEFLGNCGSASLPVTASVAAEQGRLRTGDRLALLGIGSGINCTMLGVEW